MTRFFNEAYEIRKSEAKKKRIRQNQNAKKQRLTRKWKGGI